MNHSFMRNLHGRSDHSKFIEVVLPVLFFIGRCNPVDRMSGLQNRMPSQLLGHFSASDVEATDYYSQGCHAKSYDKYINFSDVIHTVIAVSNYICIYAMPFNHL